ncbi:MAG: cupredoxin domain-containing protein [Burkholderiaceae bacterium]|jgi:cytochrome c oxidase subunit 2
MRAIVKGRFAPKCFVGMAALGLLFGLGPSRADNAPEEKVVKIVAQRFHYTPSEITLKRGEAVQLEFTSLDFLHGFKVPDLGVRASLPPGQTTVVHIKPDKVGRFVFLCDNFCGDGHEDMDGVFIVTE